MTYIQTWTQTNWAGSSALRQERDDLHSNLDLNKLGREFSPKTREGWLTFKPGPRQTGQGVRAGTATQVRPNQGCGAATQVSRNLAHAACRHQRPLRTEKLNIALNTIVLASGLGLLHCVSMHTGTLNAVLHIFNTPSWAVLWISPWTLQMWHCTLLSW